jgi:hypothetical protein
LTRWQVFAKLPGIALGDFVLSLDFFGGFQMPNIRPMATIGEKWLNRAGSAGPQYAAGVKQPKQDWATNAAAAQPNWNAGVQMAATAGSFGKGVQAAGTGKWQQKASTLGAQRYPQGVADAGPAYQKGFSPYAQVISQTTLPPRASKGNPANLQRVNVMATALHQAKVGGVTS